MKKEVDLKRISERLTSFLKLKSSPVGFKFFKSEHDLALERPKFKMPVCQIIGNARWNKKVLGATADDMLCHYGAACIGLMDKPEWLKTGEFYIELKVTEDPEVAKAIADGIPKIEKKVEAFAVGPLESITFNPDLVIIYGDTEQIMRLITTTCGALKIPRLTMSVLGDTGICGDGIPQAFNTKKPVVFVPCIGDRAYANVTASELAMVFPASVVNEELVDHVEMMDYQLPTPRRNLFAPLGAVEEVMERFVKVSVRSMDTGTPLK